MSRPIDEKIVAMKMDNSDFKRKASETTGLFGKLTQSLTRIPTTSLGNVTKELSGIQRAANSTDLSGMAKSVDSIASRFSNLGVVATTALVNISNRATDAAMNMWRGLTTQPVMDGFREYETKMGSIQTILANTQSKGTTLEDVKYSLENLNAYADQTIYNFAEMTKNIGLFTNAGLGLEESTSMIKGFSNAAAASGTNSENAARAAYQLSQGLSSGTIIQQDWMSLTNAGMGNDNMKRDLLAIAKARGDYAEAMEGMSDDDIISDWKNLLTEGRWLTSGTMSTYLQAMAGDLTEAELRAQGLTEEQTKILLLNAKTGLDAATKVRTFTQLMSTLKEGVGSSWATSFELIFGDFEQATKLWTGINDFIGPIFEAQGKSRNALLKAVFRDGEALSNLMGGFKNILSPIGSLVKAIGAGFRMAFPPTGVSGVKNMLEGFKNLTSVFRLSSNSVSNLKTIFAGFFSIFAIGFKVIQGAFIIFMSLLPSFDGLGAKLLQLVAMVFKIPLSFNKATDSVSMFEKVLNFLVKVADTVASALEFIVGGIIIFGSAVNSAWKLLSDGDFTGGPWNEDSVIVDKLMTIRKHVVNTINAIQEAWSILTKGDFTGQSNWQEDSSIVEFLFKVRDAVKDFGSAIGDMDFSLEPLINGFTSFFGAIKDGFNWVIEKATAFGNAIKENMPNGDQLMAGGFMAALVGVVGMAMKITWDWYNIITNLGGGIGESLEGVGDALGAFALQMQAQSLLLAAVAVGILAASLWLLQDLNFKQIGSGIYAMLGSMSVLVGALAVMDKFSVVGGGFGVVVQIIALATAFAILSVSLKLLSTMSWEEITKGVLGLVGTMGAFSLAVAMMSKFGGANLGASALQIVAIAGAMLIMAGAIKLIGMIDTNQLIKGMVTIGVVLAQMGLFLKLSNGAKFSVGATIGILALGFAIKQIVSAIEKIAEIDVKMLAKGLGLITLILAVVGGFSMLAGPTMLTAGVGILLLSVALNALIIPIAALGNMSLKTLAIGIGAMAIAVLALAGASMLMTSGIAGAFAMVVIAGALHLLIVPIATLGSMQWGTILKGVFGLALALGVLGGVAALLGLAAPYMLAFVIVLGVASVAMMLAGVGISLLGVGLVNLAALGSAAVVTIIATIATLIAGLTSLIPAAVNLIIRVILAIATAIATNAPVLYSKVLEMVLGMLQVFADNVPKFITVAADIVTNILNTLSQKAPEMALAATNFITSMIEAMATAVQTNGPRLQAAIQTLMAEVLIIFVDTGISVIQALFGWIPGVTEATNAIGSTAEETIRSAFGAKEVGTEKGSEFASGLSGKKGDAQNAGSAVASGAETGADTANLNPIGSGAGSEFASGLLSKTGSASAAGNGLANAGKTAAASIDMSSTGNNFGLGFANGITGGGVLDRVVSAGKAIASAAKNAVADWLDMHSPSRLMVKDGGFFTEGFAIGIAKMAGSVASSAKGVAMTARDTLSKFVDDFSIPEEDNELHFKAVIDYDRFNTNGFGNMNKLSLQPDLALSSGLARETVAQYRQNGYTPQETKSQPVVYSDDRAKQPLIVQSILNGKILAEEIIEDVSRLQNHKQQVLDRARGVY